MIRKNPYDLEENSMKKIVDKNYCMSSFLAFRYVAREDMIFGGGVTM